MVVASSLGIFTTTSFIFATTIFVFSTSLIITTSVFVASASVFIVSSSTVIVVSTASFLIFKSLPCGVFFESTCVRIEIVRVCVVSWWSDVCGVFFLFSTSSFRFFTSAGVSGFCVSATFSVAEIIVIPALSVFSLHSLIFLAGTLFAKSVY